jgi:STE24 endopeptidase
MAEIIFIVIVFILVADYLLERYLDKLNSKRWSNELPEELKGIYDEEKYRRSQDYERVKHKYSFVTDTFGLCLILLMLFMGGFAFVDDISRSICDNRILISLIFFAVIGVAFDIMTTPFDIYATFVIEERFGFNRTSKRTYILDKIKSWLLAAIIGGGLLALIMWIYMETGSWFWLVAWAVVSGFMIFMAMFYSTLIVPLFNKQTPLDSGPLRDEIEKFALKTGFKLDNIFVIDGSKRSTKANAYFSGLGARKRIVLYDTLINDHTKEELVAVLAHEIGHYWKKHTLKGIVLSVLHNGLLLFILSLFLGNTMLDKALGVAESSFHLEIIAFGLLYSPLSMVLGIVMNMYSRRNEFEADRFAKDNYDGKALQDALKKLSVNNLSNLRPHPLYVFFYYSHPPLLERLKALEDLSEEKSSSRPGNS